MFFSRATLVFSLLASLLSRVLAQDFSCGPEKPCAIGCCGINNVCGLGPAYCAQGNCTHECGAKSDCDPGWGSQWSSAEKCPLNVCCSDFGFCGTTAEFCGSAGVASPSCTGGSSSNQRTIGYYEGWSITRNCDQMYPENLPIGAYTHLNFAFAFVDPVTFSVAPMDETQIPLFTRLTGLKNRMPGLQVWISIGGWSMNDPDQPTATTFSDLAGSTDAQSKFFASLISFMSTYGFDGVDIDWEYPVAPERSGRPEDFANYVSFLRNLRNAFAASGHNYGVSITIPSSYWYLQHFDIVNIASIIDWFNLMSYDLHGTWDSTDPFVGSIVGAHTNLTEIDQALQLMWRNDIDPSKVVLGLGFYGRSFTLANPSCTAAGCPFSGGAPAGDCTGNVGTLSFPEINRLIGQGAQVTLDKDAAVQIVTYGGNNWVSYDDAETFKMKIDYANDHCLGGTMVWAASLDDKQGTAAGVLGGVTGRKALSLAAISASSDPITSCVFSECGLGDNCPAGTRPVIVANHPDKSAGIGISEGNNACRDEWDSTGDTRFQRVYCCPPNDPPTCRWGGTSPFCNGRCNDDEVQVATGINGDGKACATGHKALCCKKKTSDQDWEKCKWEGTAPFCKGEGCSEDDRKPLVTTTWGQGGEQPCNTGTKSYCCTQPPPFKGCVWNKHGDDNSLFQNPFVCQGKCPAGKQLIATDIGSCIWGSQAYCCDTEEIANNPTLSDFTNKLTTFKQNPVCNVQGSSSKREVASFDAGSNGSTVLNAKRATSLGWGTAFDLAPIIAGSTSRSTGLDLLISDTFDEQFGNSNNMHLSDFVTEQGLFPGFDIDDLIFDALCQGASWVVGFRELQGAQTSVCHTLPAARKGRSAENATIVPSTEEVTISKKRNFWLNNDLASVGAGRPTTGALMSAIIQGTLNVAYIAVERLGPGQNNHLLVEIAWDIRNHRSLQETGNDVLGVMHLHVDNLAFSNGHTYLGIQFASFFHAQEVYRQHQQRWRAVGWRTGNADATQNVNARAGINECDRNEDQRWWLGFPIDQDLDEAVIQLGNALVAQNIVNDHLLEGLFEPSTYYDDRTDPGLGLSETHGFYWDGAVGEELLSRSLTQTPDGLYGGDFTPGTFPAFTPNPPANPPYGGGDPIKLKKRETVGSFVTRLGSKVESWVRAGVKSIRVVLTV